MQDLLLLDVTHLPMSWKNDGGVMTKFIEHNTTILTRRLEPCRAIRASYDDQGYQLSRHLGLRSIAWCKTSHSRKAAALATASIPEVTLEKALTRVEEDGSAPSAVEAAASEQQPWVTFGTDGRDCCHRWTEAAQEAEEADWPKRQLKQKRRRRLKRNRYSRSS